MRLVRYLLVVLLAAQLTGVSWLGLLAVSKARQTCRNAKQSGLAVALKKIPKGKGNCATCKKIRLARTKQTQQQQFGMPSGLGLLGFAPTLLPTSLFVHPLLDSNSDFVAALPVWHALEHSPPTPPPRA